MNSAQVIFKKSLFLIILFSSFFLINFNEVFAAGTDDFVITAKTDNTGTSTDTQFTIPAGTGTFNYNVDCDNDGTDEATAQTGSYTCSYGSAGTYTVRIEGTFPHIYFNNTGDKEKILSVEQWGTGVWGSMEKAFYGAANLVVNATDNPNLSSVTNMSYMFSYASAFNQDISSWNVSNVTNMSYMFYGASAFNQDISSWNVSNVTTMSSMFYYASVFNQDISLWNVSNVTSMWSMFSYTLFNQDIGSWDVSNVTNMSYMFRYTSSFNQDISLWNVSNVTGMFFMFYDVTLSVSNYDALLNGWNAQVLQNGVTFHGGNSTYCAITARDNMTAVDGHNWTITDGGLGTCNNDPTDIKLDAGDSDSVNENTTSGTNISALTTTDADAGDTHTYTLVSGTGNEDNAKFTISGTNLQLAFTPDYELPTDLGDTAGNNTYAIRLQTDDGNGGTYQEAFIITVLNVNEAPTITNVTPTTMPENSVADQTISASDVDAGDTLTYSISGGLDSSLFGVSGSILTFNSARDFENPTDDGENNIYNVTVRATDTLGLFDDYAVAVTITNENESATFTSVDEIDVEENQTAIITVTATDPEGDGLTFSLNGGDDESLFTLTGDILTFTTSPDFENPSDLDSDNIYEVIIEVSDGTDTDTQTISVTVTNISEGKSGKVTSRERVCRDSKASNFEPKGMHTKALCIYETKKIIPETKSSTIKMLQEKIAELIKQIQKIIETKEKLNSNPQQQCFYFSKYFKFGDRGEEIKKIQTFLNEQGFFNHSVTGFFGEVTKQAIKDFQSKYSEEILKPWGHTTPTGRWYKTTISKANKLITCTD